MRGLRSCAPCSDRRPDLGVTHLPPGPPGFSIHRSLYISPFSEGSTSPEVLESFPVTEVLIVLRVGTVSAKASTWLPEQFCLFCWLQDTPRLCPAPACRYRRGQGCGPLLHTLKSCRVHLQNRKNEPQNAAVQSCGVAHWAKAGPTHTMPATIPLREVLQLL